ncbi:hypothetical protein BDW75DRAFT_13891 [Aspergillus navahoensis]
MEKNQVLRGAMSNRGLLVIFFGICFLEVFRRYAKQAANARGTLKLGRSIDCCVQIANMTLDSETPEHGECGGSKSATLQYCRIRHRMTRPTLIGLSAGNPASAALSLHPRPAKSRSSTRNKQDSAVCTSWCMVRPRTHGLLRTLSVLRRPEHGQSSRCFMTPSRSSWQHARQAGPGPRAPYSCRLDT